MRTEITRRQLLQFLSGALVSGIVIPALAREPSEGLIQWVKHKDQPNVLRALDNDEVAAWLAEGKAQIVSSDSFSDIGSTQTFLNFEQVTAALTPEIEAHFQHFVLVNTAKFDIHATIDLPPQSMTILGRAADGGPVFVRGADGEAVDFTSEALHFRDQFFSSRLQGALAEAMSEAQARGITLNPMVSENRGLLPVSTGNEDGGEGIRTFSGVFQIQIAKTKAHVQESINDPMSYAQYIHHQYGVGGRWSGVAIHGTPPGGWRKLGQSRASHGCVRTLPPVAKVLRRYFFETASTKTAGLPEFSSSEVLPVLTGRNFSEPRPHTLFIFFNGYKNPAQLT